MATMPIFIEQQHEAEFVVVSGSMPPGVPPTIFSAITDICNKINARLLLTLLGKR
jgi:fructose-1-phosphate kinase PfkB-like protein